MKRSITVFVIIVLLAIAAFSASAFIVTETEQVVVVQFGEVVRLVDKPGLNFKIPFIQDAKRFEKRWLEWDGDANQITTRDKRYIYIDVFARWRISEPLVFIETLRDEISAQGRLDDIIDNATRNVVANHNLIEAIRSTNRELVYTAEETAFSVNTIREDNTTVLDGDRDEPADEKDTAASGDEADTDQPAEDKHIARLIGVFDVEVKARALQNLEAEVGMKGDIVVDPGGFGGERVVCEQQGDAEYHRQE